MEEVWSIWHGQLWVGTRNLGSTTIWSYHNSFIPGIGGSLKMTSIAEYGHLWTKILKCNPVTMFRECPQYIQGKTVSVFGMTSASDSPEFAQLAEELTETEKPQILTCEIVNPMLQIQVVIVPQCTELKQLGLNPLPATMKPLLNIIFIVNATLNNAINIYKDLRGLRLSECLLVRRDMSYATLEDVQRNGGDIYIKSSALDHLFAHPHLRTMCSRPQIQFGVYNSLLAVLNGDAIPILKSKWVFLVHHTTMLEKSFGRILEEVLKDGNINNQHHHHVFVPLLTLKTCYVVLSNRQKNSTREQQLHKVLKTNMSLVEQCIKAGVAQVIPGKSYLDTLSPASPTLDYLASLKILHRCLKYGHRHTTVLVGDRFPVGKSNHQSFYNISTVSDIINANFLS
ncbi:uncharacterized protein LOC121864260 isoform X3 [Homarus americanus]|uniref:uncharacterized protein LOC121864260 isoform X3 n=1 Tax=Homarus americanus TaxID=6706 RepID=UPI001C476A67|nr:uncharacterized protein LOC121864260 isoform X3 [Homarus americanus]